VINWHDFRVTCSDRHESSFRFSVLYFYCGQLLHNSINFYHWYRQGIVEMCGRTERSVYSLQPITASQLETSESFCYNASSWSPYNEEEAMAIITWSVRAPLTYWLKWINMSRMKMTRMFLQSNSLTDVLTRTLALFHMNSWRRWKSVSIMFWKLKVRTWCLRFGPYENGIKYTDSKKSCVACCPGACCRLSLLTWKYSWKISQCVF
jgi:hypothetical protein